MESNNKSFNFQKLDGSNYYDWSWHMKLYLRSKELFGHADGTETCPEDGRPAIAAWKRADEKAHTAICLAIENDQSAPVRNTNTAAAAWAALQNKFECSSLSEQVRLLREFHSLRLDPGGDVRAHINRMDNLNERLRQMGYEIQDKHLAMTLLSSLSPEEFGPTLASLDVRQNRVRPREEASSDARRSRS
jgi:hypothetical protein